MPYQSTTIKIIKENGNVEWTGHNIVPINTVLFVFTLNNFSMKISFRLRLQFAAGQQLPERFSKLRRWLIFLLNGTLIVCWQIWSTKDGASMRQNLWLDGLSMDCWINTVKSTLLIIRVDSNLWSSSKRSKLINLIISRVLIQDRQHLLDGTLKSSKCPQSFRCSTTSIFLKVQCKSYHATGGWSSFSS